MCTMHVCRLGIPVAFMHALRFTAALNVEKELCEIVLIKDPGRNRFPLTLNWVKWAEEIVGASKTVGITHYSK